MNVVNLTPHAICILDADGSRLAEFKPDGTVARVSQTREMVGSLNGIPVYRSKFGAVVGLPAPVSGTAFLVSALVRVACPDRNDIYSPGELVRDASGQPIGCRGLEGA